MRTRIQNDNKCRLAEIVRHGRTSLPGEGSVEPDNPVWVEFAHSMAPMMAPMAGPLGSIVLDGISGPLRVLEIAAGHGLFGIEVAKQHPLAEIVAVNWAPVLEVAQGMRGKQEWRTGTPPFRGVPSK